MAKKDLKVAPTVETLKPYLDRALNDKEFREDLKEALSAARKLYGPLVKDAKGDGAAKSASRLATDAKVQENLRKALEEFGKAAGSLKGEEEEPQGPERDAARRPHRRRALQPVVGPADARVADGQGRRRRRPPAARRLRPPRPGRVRERCGGGRERCRRGRRGRGRDACRSDET